jgi:hypothetical protein
LLFVYSLDYARTRLANDNKSATKGGSRQFNGLVDVYRKTLASDGIAGLYRGFVPSVVGIIVYRGLYFGLYDSIKPVLLVGPLEGNFLASFALGWGVTTGAGLASYPLDTIRRRMMMTSGGAVHYKSMMDAGSQIVAKEGIRSLFKGAGANILRGVAGAGVLSLYDKMQELMFGKVYGVSVDVLAGFELVLIFLGWFGINVNALYYYHVKLSVIHTIPLSTPIHTFYLCLHSVSGACRSEVTMHSCLQEFWLSRVCVAPVWLALFLRRFFQNSTTGSEIDGNDNDAHVFG